MASSNYTLSVGVVKNNADPIQNGRLQIWIPAVDSSSYSLDDLPWALYVSPIGGVTAQPKVGRGHDEIDGITSYGFWAIPKNGAQVLVGHLEGDPQMRFWMGCLWLPELNRTMPQGIDGYLTEIDESEVYGQGEMEPLKSNMTEAGLGPDHPNFKTVGGYERSVSYPLNKTETKPTTNGYASKPHEPDKADSQMFAIKTPGGHYLLMSDINDRCRIRLKTPAGSQVLLDDTNERIYFSTAKGRNWIELDEGNGNVNVYSAGKINYHAENDINFYSDQNINIVAKKRLNLVSEERGVKVQGALGLQFVSQKANVKITASRDIHLKTTNGPKGGAVSESQSCSRGPYSGTGLGLLTDHAEEAGSSSSNVFINAQGVNVRSDAESILITSATSIQAKASSGVFKAQASSVASLEGVNTKMTVDSGGLQITGPVRVDGELGVVGPITSGSSISSPATGTSRGVKVAPGSAGKTTASVASPGASAASSEGVKKKMVIPEHESWNRKSVDSACQPDRNESYEG